ncbi:MAG: ABC transporter permease [Acidobacteria bacterium]|nr:ABC transporter permease [Acidobacteriota bacterium]
MIITLILLYVPLAAGVVLTFRVLRFPDLTIDGSFTLGAATVAVFALHGSPLLGILIAPAAGAMAGAATASLYAFGRLNKLVAGIVVLTALYTLTLRLMGAANIQLITTPTVLTFTEERLGSSGPLSAVAVAAAGVVGVLGIASRTVGGLALRATGDNSAFVRQLGKSERGYLITGLAVGNALVALTGAEVAMFQGFADVNMGVGTLVTGLTVVFLGASLVRSEAPTPTLLSGLVGVSLYMISVQVALRVGVNPIDLKLATAALLCLIILLMRHNKDVVVLLDTE